MTVDLRLGDCLDVLRGMADKSVDAVVTDPPYPGLKGGIDHSFSGGVAPRRSDYQVVGEPWGGDLSPLKECQRVARYGAIVFCSYHSVTQVPALVGGTPIALLTWYKRNSQPSIRNRPHYTTEYIWVMEFNPGANWKCLETFYDIPGLQAGCMATERITERGGKATHPTQKPVALMLEMVRPFSGEILDPYMGTGTTGLAAHRMGLPFVGVEKNPEYFAIAQRRIAAAQAQPALFQV